MEPEIEEDFLEVDKPIPGQNYVCLSFISPEKVLKKREIFFMTKFLQDLLNDADPKKKEYLMNLKDITYDKVNDMIEDFRVVNEKKINDEFNDIVDFQTSVRGIKIRGTYETNNEARVRAKILRRKDKKHHVFVGQVGYWLPWDPNPSDIADQEYQESQLNELMKKYNENMASVDAVYEEDKNMKIQQARDKNKKIKEEQLKNKELRE